MPAIPPSNVKPVCVVTTLMSAATSPFWSFTCVPAKFAVRSLGNGLNDVTEIPCADKPIQPISIIINITIFVFIIKYFLLSSDYLL